jgi:hypothetical protein
MTSKPWYHKGLQFNCTQCGNCCRNHGEYTYVYVTEPEIQAISGHLGLSRAAFLEKYCTKEEGSWYSLRMDEPACPFLGADSRCGIYPVRPKQCQTWPFWEENLKQATWKGAVKECCPGIDQGTLYPAEEVQRQARETEAQFE